MLPLTTVTEVAHRFELPVIVVASGVLPRVENLTRFVDEGADAVAFGGGKGIGGPAGTGFLAGRRDLVLSATLQQQDMYVHPSLWSGPFGPSSPAGAAGPARQGLGRMLKVGREEIAGLIAALESYVQRDHAAEELRIAALATDLAERLAGLSGATVSLSGATGTRWRHVVLDFAEHGGAARAAEVARNLRYGSPRVFCLDAWIDNGLLLLQAATLREEEIEPLVERVTAECASRGGS